MNKKSAGFNVVGKTKLPTRARLVSIEPLKEAIMRMDMGEEVVVSLPFFYPGVASHVAANRLHSSFRHFGGIHGFRVTTKSTFDRMRIWKLPIEARPDETEERA